MSSASTVTTLLEIRLFGTPEVQVGGRPLPSLHSRRGLWLLALLAVNQGQTIERSRLAGLLWPDSPETTALHNLRQTLADLRRALGPGSSALSSPSPRTLQLEPELSDVDVVEFDRHIADGSPEALECAASIYRGNLLEGCGEPWAIQERRQREEAYLCALEGLAAHCSAAGDHSSAARWLRRAIAADPYRESAHRALMQALADAGELASATEVYRDLRELLHRELNAQPDPQTVDKYRTIKSKLTTSTQSQSQQPARRIQRLPVTRTGLIGRDTDALEVVQLLDRSRLVTLAGTGGIGKTSLALKVANDIEAATEQSVVFVDLAPLSDLADVPEAVRVAAAAPEGPADALVSYLATRRILLVLDNCEHLLTACASLSDALLTHCPNVRILATSRHALGLRGETIWRVPSLALPPTVREKDVASYAAIKLFLERARSAESSFKPTPGIMPDILEICRKLEGIPLAIELAAARVRSVTVQEINTRLSAGLSLLAGGGPNILPRHHTLNGAFEWSWGLLEEPERDVLSRLSVFAGGCSLAAAESVCSGGNIEEAEVLNIITSLVDKSLVVYLQSTADEWDESEPRYRLLEPVRQFASEHLRRSGDESDVRSRHRDFYLAWSEEVEPKLWKSNMAFWFNRLEIDHDNLRTAIDSCRLAAEDAANELRFAIALGRFWDTCGHLREGRARFESILARVSPDISDGDRACALVKVGWMAIAQCDWPAAQQHCREAAAIHRALGNHAELCRALNYLASATTGAGDFANARGLFEESVALCRTLGNRKQLAAVLNNLGEVMIYQGDIASARPAIEETIGLCEMTGQMGQLHGIALCNLSVTDFREGRYTDAGSRCDQGLQIAYDCHALVDIPRAIEQMAIIAAAEMRWERAARLLGAAEAIAEEGGVAPPIILATERQDAVTRAKHGLGADQFAAEVRKGRSMTLDVAVAYALEL